MHRGKSEVFPFRVDPFSEGLGVQEVRRLVILYKLEKKNCRRVECP